MGSKLQTTKLGDFYYEENAILIWLCRCYKDRERCQEAIERYMEAGVSLIVTMTAPALEVALASSVDSGIPLIFTHISKLQIEEFKSRGLITAGRVTGICDIWQDMVGERLALLTQVTPPLNVVHSFYNPQLLVAVTEMERLRRASNELGLELIPHPACSPADIKSQLADLKTRSDHVIFRLSDPTTESMAGLMGAVAHEHFIPYVGLTSDELERNGSLLALDVRGIGKQLAEIIDRILRGENPQAIPLQEPSEKVLFINNQVAQNLGLILSPSLRQATNNATQLKHHASLRTRLLLIVLIACLFNVVAFPLGFPNFFYITLIAGIFFSLAVYFYLDWTFIRPLQKLTINAEKIGAGDLNVDIGEGKVDDEVNTLARALRRMKSNLNDSYGELEQMADNLKIRVNELTEANQALKLAQVELEIAGTKLIAAEDNSRFAMTTFIHDEILSPLDTLIEAGEEKDNPTIIRSAKELEKRIRRLRFDLSVPILQDLSIELRRLIQETLPQIYPISQPIELKMDLAALDQLPDLESACVFLLYRFAHGAVSNVYRHAKATQVAILAEYKEGMLKMQVRDNGCGFDTNQLEQFIKNGHYFFHDIKIRSQQMKGSFRVESKNGCGTTMEVIVPARQNGSNSSRKVIQREENKAQ
ncbi:MAG: ABC transporter substrate binding protein [Anaerolineales bacterium]